MSKKIIAKKRNPMIAVILAIFFGPLGFFYIGRRYGIMAIVSCIFYVVLISLLFLNFPSPSWMEYIILLVFVSKTFTITTTRNRLIDIVHDNYLEEDELKFIDSFSGATMAMTDMMIGMGLWYTLAICLYMSILMFSDGHIMKGIIMLIGTPIFVYFSQLVFGTIAVGIDLVMGFITKSGRKTKNIYSNKWRI